MAMNGFPLLKGQQGPLIHTQLADNVRELISVSEALSQKEGLDLHTE